MWHIWWDHNYISWIEKHFLGIVSTEYETHLTFDYLGNLLVVMIMHGNSKTILEIDPSHGDILAGHNATLHTLIYSFEFDLLPID